MIEVSIPNNIKEHKPKFILGFTGRQFVCIVLMAVFVILSFVFLKPYIGDLVIVIAAVPAFICACFGWGDKFTPGNVPFEKYMKSALFQVLLAPKWRKAMTVETSFVIPCDKYYEPIPDSAVSAEVLECVNYVREHLGIAADEEPEKRKGLPGKKKFARPKYKKSKQAIL